MPQIPIRAIFAALHHHGVRYVLVGALGAVAHGARLHTGDVDICPALDDDNLRRVAAALGDLGAKLIREPSRGMAAIDMGDWRTLRLADPAEHHLFATPFGEIDVLPFLLGSGGWGTTTSYEELAPRAVTVPAFGLPIPVAAFDAIAVSKLAAGRPQDQEAAEELRRVSELLRGGEQPTYGLEQLAGERSTP